MKGPRAFLLAVLPRPLRASLKSIKQWFRTHVADHFCFPVWLLLQCLRHRKRAVILSRIGALGDVLCTLPMVGEIRKRHPQRLLVFVTATDYKKMVQLSKLPDAIYGARSWSFTVPGKFFGLIEIIYEPFIKEERSYFRLLETESDGERVARARLASSGAQCHLVDDLAGSCGVTLAHRQPRLFPSPELLRKTQACFGLAESIAQGRLVIGISCGRTWSVRMWEATKWQQLVELIHLKYDAIILQFGFTRGPGSSDEYDQIKGVISVTNRLKSDELVALIASCRLLVSIDSGPVHIAGAVGTPVVGLFGAISPHHRLPPESPAVGLVAEVPCLYCHHATPIGHWQKGCLNNIRCMKELGVEKVFQAIESMLSTLPAKK